MNSCSVHALQVPHIQPFTLLVLEMLAHQNISKTLVWVGGWTWFPSLSCCGVWDDPNRSKTACSSREPLRISLKIKYGKDFPFGLHVLPRAIMFYHTNRYKLSWVILSLAEWWVHSRKVLVIYWSFSIAYPLFASLKCPACQLPTPGIDIHLRQTIPLIAKPKISTVSLSISNGLSKQCSPSNNSSRNSHGVWVIFLKKIGQGSKERKRKMRQDPYLHSRYLK